MKRPIWDLPQKNTFEDTFVPHFEEPFFLGDRRVPTDSQLDQLGFLWEVTWQRGESVSDAVLELMEQNVPDLPPGGVAAWQQMLRYTSSTFRYVFLG